MITNEVITSLTASVQTLWKQFGCVLQACGQVVFSARSEPPHGVLHLIDDQTIQTDNLCDFQSVALLQSSSTCVTQVVCVQMIQMIKWFSQISVRQTAIK